LPSASRTTCRPTAEAGKRVLALHANRYLDPRIALNQLRNRRTVVEQRQGAAAHVGERLLRVDA
jgi:hypothetical protein